MNNIELSPSDMEVVKSIISKRLEQINQQGGINGKELRVTYLDDQGSPETAQQVVRETMNDKHLIGYIGCWSSTRSKAVSTLIGPARIPFIGGYALTNLFEQYPNMYTAEQGIRNVAANFEKLLLSGYLRPSFVGKKDDLYSIAILEKMYELERKNPSFRVVHEKWFPGEHTYIQADFDSLNKVLKAEKSDFLVLSFESLTTSALIKEIRKAGIDVPVFTALGDLGFVASIIDKRLAGELYDLNVVGIPGTFNLRLQEQIPAFRREIRHSETLELQLSFGARLADSIGIIAEAAKSGNADPADNIRERINRNMMRYIGGSRIYRGWFNDWYFTPERAIAGDVLLAWKPSTSRQLILAPKQYMPINDTLRQVPVLYTHMDMVQLNRVSDTEGSFYASFYLEITSSNPFSMQQLDFTNAARSETSHEYLLDIKKIRERRQLHDMHLYNYMYKISGKFLFEPDLRNYPFDRQRFSISFQPSSALYPFLVQPSPPETRDTVFQVRGWEYSSHYVGFDHDIISFVNTFRQTQQTVPFYKFSYTFVLERARIDFFLKVLTPLLVILTITYFSVYIPLYRFETLEAIQVTSLLASIALYFSAYKPQMEYATISDKIFIFTYIMITSLIGTSILQFVKRKKHNTESHLAKAYQRYVFPIIVLTFTLLIVW
ncbi:ABC transporter substrate-binding protein [Pontibacter sp. JH31]|uniref:ABC transporter substrate-binding protein n=1 Tax=Pontibacter aquaedesilientis TaxID=2766980 RepID=A0ABR7XHH9_9BACT|nr:ABC transporter substrate-binding protein [Pontibacter aquaedesilientis]MBD1397737.1 ABC transporter substrate-binding protein [Pontibacter aquaedesilientis]